MFVVLFLLLLALFSFILNIFSEIKRFKEELNRSILKCLHVRGVHVIELKR